MNIEQEIAREVLEYVPGADGEADSRTIAAAIMPLVRRAQAEALRDAAGEIEATFADYDRRRPLHPKAEVSTDYVNDPQWAELIVRNRADRIEQEVEHD